MKKLFILCVIFSFVVVVAFFLCPQYVDSTKFLSTKVEIKALQTAFELFFLDYKRYPFAEEGLPSLVNPPTGRIQGKRKFIENLPYDPWGNTYNYLAPEKIYNKPRIYSNGPNGFDDKGDLDDIVSWDKEYTCELNNIGCIHVCDIMPWILFLLATILWLILAIWVVSCWLKLGYIKFKS